NLALLLRRRSPGHASRKPSQAAAIRPRHIKFDQPVLIVVIGEGKALSVRRPRRPAADGEDRVPVGPPRRLRLGNLRQGPVARRQQSGRERETRQAGQLRHARTPPSGTSDPRWYIWPTPGLTGS